MLQIKISFGFKSMALDNLLVIYTGKIRIKADLQDVTYALGHVNGLSITQHKNGCVCISYATIDCNIHCSNMANINAYLCIVMHQRIDAKYNPFAVTKSTVINDFEDLTF